MGFNAYSRIDVTLRPGTTRQQVEDACRDFLDWRGYELLTNDSDLSQTGVAFERATRSFTLQITSECPHGFAIDTFRPLVLAIGELAEEPFTAILVNEDTSNDDSREFPVVAGPADQIGEYRFGRALCAIEDQLPDIDLPPGTPGATVAELASKERMTFSTTGPGTAACAAVARVTVDLTGLEFDAARRDRIARLATTLAREIAGNDLRLSTMPGSPTPGVTDEDLEQRFESPAPRG